MQKIPKECVTLFTLWTLVCNGVWTRLIVMCGWAGHETRPARTQLRVRVRVRVRVRGREGSGGVGAGVGKGRSGAGGGPVALSLRCDNFLVYCSLKIIPKCVAHWKLCLKSFFSQNCMEIVLNKWLCYSKMCAAKFKLLVNENMWWPYWQHREHSTQNPWHSSKNTGWAKWHFLVQICDFWVK